MAAPQTQISLRSKNTEAGKRLALIEWPTVSLVAVVYIGWLVITWHWQALPLGVALPLSVILVTLHGSLQHEILHGHPTSWRKINRLMAIVPLSLWLPYERYRQSHLIHHIDEHLTDPLDDPETYYWTQADWDRQPRLLRWLLKLQACLLGRVIIGPFWNIVQFLAAEIDRLRRNEGRCRAIWLEHALWCFPVLGWLALVCSIPVWLYVLAVILPATGIQMIRSFAEHRAQSGVRERIAIVENSWLLGPLFLFNNLHSVHHEAPMMPWYQYHAWYNAHRERLLRENGGLVYNSYFDVARRFMFTPHDALVHPLLPRMRA